MITFLSYEGYAIYGTRFKDPVMGSCKFEGTCGCGAEFSYILRNGADF